MITKLKCSSHKKYKAVRKPTCGCLKCHVRYYFFRQTAKRSVNGKVQSESTAEVVRETSRN